jgi:hypothetical protein
MSDSDTNGPNPETAPDKPAPGEKTPGVLAANVVSKFAYVLLGAGLVLVFILFAIAADWLLFGDSANSVPCACVQ